MGFDRTMLGGAAAAKVAGLGVAALLATTIAVAPGQALAADADAGQGSGAVTDDLADASAGSSSEGVSPEGGAGEVKVEATAQNPTVLNVAEDPAPSATKQDPVVPESKGSTSGVTSVRDAGGQGSQQAKPQADASEQGSDELASGKGTGVKQAASEPSSGQAEPSAASASDATESPAQQHEPDVAAAAGKAPAAGTAPAPSATPAAQAQQASPAASREPAPEANPTTPPASSKQAPEEPEAAAPAAWQQAAEESTVTSQESSDADATSVATASAAESEGDPQNVYRVYNPWSGEHLYTSSYDEARNLFGIGWQWEGISYQADKKTGKAVYRLYNPYAGNHLYTLDKAESDYLTTLGWRYEDVAWYSVGDQPLYRLFNPYSAIGEHLYTTSASERDTAARAGWNYEGIAWGVTPGFVSVNGAWVVSSSYGSQERYWIQSDGNLAKDRYIQPSEGTGYSVAAYARPNGAVVRGAWYDGGNHVYLADGDGRLANQAEGWLVTSAYDGHNLQRYYMDGLGRAKTGEFNVDGKDYLGRTDTGYVVRGTYFLGDTRYIANNDGVIQSKMSRKQIYVDWAKGIAADNSHGYSQINRWGPNYDCSALVISALRQAGYETGAANSTRDMRRELTRYGWQVVAPNPNDLQYGDILLHDGVHTALWCGNGQLVEAWEDENGSWEGYRSGDQTGQEIRVRSYYDDGWLCYLRHA